MSNVPWPSDWPTEWQKKPAGEKRVAIMTGGGDCPGLNAVIRAVVKTAAQNGVRVFGIERAFGGLLGNGKVRELTNDDVKDILNRGGTILGTTNRGNPFRFETDKGGRGTIDRSPEVMGKLKALGIDAVISVGGDGSQRISLELVARGINVIGVPKTIDNDLGGTEVTFGFNTAVEIATEALDRLHSTAESHDRVMILEVMGRDAGFIALHTAIAGAADICLIPEIPYDMAAIIDRITHRVRRGTFFSLVVVAEGAKAKGGDVTILETRKGAMPRYGGVGHVVAHEIIQRTDREVRVTVLGHIQRGGTPSSYDRLLATRMGAHAVDAFLRGEESVLVGVEGDRMITTPLDKAVAIEKRVDPKGELVRMARAIGMGFGD
ncbi:MAG: 6-phosphofructokinase [Deltaproteobacteria bacterium]|nr:6-phosphofructokinase [Deltaproteobacteria bacterium]